MVRVKQITESQMTFTHLPNFTEAGREQLPQPITGARILVLASDLELLGDVPEQLAGDDVQVITAPSAKAAQVRLYGQQPAAVLLSAELDGGTGYALLEALRADGTIAADVPAIAFSANAGPLNRVRALQRGCVDFLALPIFFPELVLRLGLAINRSASRPAPATIHIDGGLSIARRTNQVFMHGQPVTITETQFQLLLVLARDPERVFSKAELMHEVWGYERNAPRSRTVDSHLCRLRVRLREAGGEYIVNHAVVWSSTALDSTSPAFRREGIYCPIGQ